MHPFYEKALSLQDKMVAIRRHIHANPEIGPQQPETSALVISELKKMGLEPKVVGHGVVALVEGAYPGKTVLIRGDMDALPMPEESGLPFASKVPDMNHACGHDIHTTTLLGAAEILAANRDTMHGTVKLMFQPGEEVGAGARQMLAEGLLENPKVDVAMGMHTMIASNVPSGKIALSPGATLASSDAFRIDIQGKGSHGSRPEEGVDPIHILNQIYFLLHTLLTREKPAQAPCVVTVCEIKSGSAPNIVPDTGYMRGSIRAYDNELRNKIKRRIVEIAESTATLLGGTAKVSFTMGLPPLINNDALTVETLGYLRELLGEENVVPMPARMASEDFAEVTALVPGTFMRLSAGSIDEGYVYGGHHPKVVFDESAMPAGAAAYAYCAYRWLEEHSN